MKAHQQNELQAVVDNLSSYLLDFTHFGFEDIPEVDGMRSYLMECLDDGIEPKRDALRKKMQSMRHVTELHNGRNLPRNNDLDKAVAILEKYL